MGFWNRSQSKDDKPTQSQSVGNVTGGSVQQVQSQKGNAIANQSTQTAVQQELTNGEVLQALAKLQEAISQSSLTPDKKNELLTYLKPAQLEVAKPEPKPERVGMSLEQVSETMQSLKETTEAGKSLWQTGTEVVKTISPWLVAAGAVVPRIFGL